ncbi:MAG: hypothetical protein IKH27_12910 [Oscillospiraceae bacterium]|nr:hypothetical protein [Oscillospiraceae bacterium]
MLKQLKNDFRYFRYSKLWMLMIVLFLASALFICYTNHQDARMKVINFRNSVEAAESAGEDVQAMLAQDYKILSMDQNSGMIENPVAFYYAEIGKSLNYMQPSRLVSLLLAGEMAFIPLLAAFFGLLWSAVDQKNRTFRYSSLRFGKQSAMISRQLSGYLLLILMLTAAVLAAYGIQAYFTHQFYAEYPELTGYTRIADGFSAAAYLKSIPFTLVLMLLYYEFGFFSGTLFKHNPVAYALVGAYLLFVRPVFRYDIANIIYNFSQKVFPYSGAFTMQPGVAAKLVPGALILAVVLLLLAAGNSLVTQKRSAY